MEFEEEKSSQFREKNKRNETLEHCDVVRLFAIHLRENEKKSLTEIGEEIEKISKWLSFLREKNGNFSYINELFFESDRSPLLDNYFTVLEQECADPSSISKHCNSLFLLFNFCFSKLECVKKILFSLYSK